MRYKSTLTTDGYCNRKHATKIRRGFSKHAASKEHLACYSIWKEKIKRSKMDKEIISLISIEAIQGSRYYFSTLIDIIAFLATHQLAFRGKIDALKSEDEGKMDSF